MSPSLIPPDRRVTIGGFARATRISARTLRKYDALGILRPIDVDPDTGYRHYTLAQYPRAVTIRLLRTLGVSLRDIATILDDDAGRRTPLLEQQLARVQLRIDEERHTVMRLESALARGGVIHAYHCELREIASQPAVALHFTSPRETIDKTLEAVLRRLERHATRHRLPVTGREIVIYDFDPFEDDDYIADACLPLAAPATTAGDMRARTLPACTAAATVHHGPDDDLPSAYASLLTWIHDRDLRITGPQREIYVVDKRDSDDPRDYVTEVLWPVAGG
jgi:effector-binding domain-containing protein